MDADEKPRAPQQFTKRTCRDCDVEFEYPRRSGPPRTRCDDCTRAYHARRQKAWRAANPERSRGHSKRHHEKRKDDPAFRQYKRDNELRRVYGLTRDQLNAMLEAQDHRCAVCGGPPNGPGNRLHVDHCHATGAVRGLLCSKCNTAIGLLGDDVDRIDRLAAYVRTGIPAPMRS